MKLEHTILVQRIFQASRGIIYIYIFFFFPANCCNVGVDDTNAQETSGPGSGGGAGGGVAVIPDRPPLELDKLPPYHDVAPSPGTYLLKYIRYKVK